MDSFLPKASTLAAILLHQHGHAFALSPGINDVAVREGQLLFNIRVSTTVHAFFDDQPLSAIWSDRGRSAYGQLDLTNQVGFHRFSLRDARGDTHYDFRTTTAKATLDEVEGMARVIAQQVFSFKRQFVYAGANGRRQAVRVAEVELGWLRERLLEVRRLVNAINARPATETRRRYVTSHQARGVSIPHTLRLLREHSGLLELLPGGPLRIAGREYWPAAVVVRAPDREPARVEHLQLAHFLSRVASTIAALRPVVPSDVEVTVLGFQRLVAALRTTRIVQSHDVPNAGVAWTPLPTKLQRTDARYRRIRELHSEFLQDIDVGDPWPDAIRTNVRDAWEIYQAFTAHMVGQAFNLSYVSKRTDLRERASRGFSMYSADFELYYDCRVSADVISSWRQNTSRPADERPDLVLYHRPSGAVAVLDAKFKVDRDSISAKAEDIFEMQGYLNSFSLSAGGIVFPGSGGGDMRIIESSGMRLAEIPLRASPFLQDSERALAKLRSDVESVLRVPLAFPEVSGSGPGGAT